MVCAYKISFLYVVMMHTVSSFRQVVKDQQSSNASDSAYAEANNKLEESADQEDVASH